MADAWDDDEFEVAPVTSQDAAWDDEEEFEPPPVINHGDAPKLSKEKADKLERERRAARDAAIEGALDEEETEGERRLRERQQVEEADHELAADLYGDSGSGSGGGATKTVVVQGLDGYALKNLKDHIALAVDVADAFEKKKSKANFRTKCVKELLKKIEDSLTSEDCDEIMGMCAGYKATIEKAKKQPTAKKAAANKPKGKSKKDLAKERDAHADLFGGFVENEYAHVEEEYEDFM